MADVADPERQLETRCAHALVSGQPGVVHQQVQRQAAREENAGALLHRRQIGQIQRQELGARAAAALRRDVGQHRPGSFFRTAGQEHMGALQGELRGGDPADAGVGAGDQGDPAGSA